VAYHKSISDLSPGLQLTRHIQTMVLKLMYLITIKRLAPEARILRHSIGTWAWWEDPGEW
jgi:hypothetical protein